MNKCVVCLRQIYIEVYTKYTVYILPKFLQEKSARIHAHTNMPSRTKSTQMHTKLYTNFKHGHAGVFHKHARAMLTCLPLVGQGAAEARYPDGVVPSVGGVKREGSVGQQERELFVTVGERHEIYRFAVEVPLELH